MVVHGMDRVRVFIVIIGSISFNLIPHENEETQNNEQKREEKKRSEKPWAYRETVSYELRAHLYNCTIDRSYTQSHRGQQRERVLNDVLRLRKRFSQSNACAKCVNLIGVISLLWSPSLVATTAEPHDQWSMAKWNQCTPFIEGQFEQFTIFFISHFRHTLILDFLFQIPNGKIWQNMAIFHRLVRHQCSTSSMTNRISVFCFRPSICERISLCNKT